MEKVTAFIMYLVRNLFFWLFGWGLMLLALGIIVSILLGLAQFILGGESTLLGKLTIFLIILVICFSSFRFFTIGDKDDDDVDVHEDPPESFNIKP